MWGLTRPDFKTRKLRQSGRGRVGRKRDKQTNGQRGGPGVRASQTQRPADREQRNGDDSGKASPCRAVEPQAAARPPRYPSTLHRAPFLKDRVLQLAGTRSPTDGCTRGGRGARRGSCGSQHSRHCAWPPGEERATASRHPRPLPRTACCQALARDSPQG